MTATSYTDGERDSVREQRKNTYKWVKFLFVVKGRHRGKDVLTSPVRQGQIHSCTYRWGISYTLLTLNMSLQLGWTVGSRGSWLAIILSSDHPQRED